MVVFRQLCYLSQLSYRGVTSQQLHNSFIQHTRLYSRVTILAFMADPLGANTVLSWAVHLAFMAVYSATSPIIGWANVSAELSLVEIQHGRRSAR